MFLSRNLILGVSVKRAIKWFAGLFMFFVPFLGLANEQRAKQDTWVITNLEPPFIKEGERGVITGYAAEVVKAILAKAKVEQDILVTRWERLEKEATSKANVIVFALARTPDREDKYHWITPLTANMYGVYAHRSPTREITELALLNQYSGVSVLRGDLRETILVNAGVSNIKRFDYWPDAVRSFVNNQDETLFFSDPGISIYCKPLKEKCENIIRIFDYDVRQSYLAVSKVGTNPHLVKTLKQAAKGFKQSQAFQKMAKYWLDEYAQTTEFPMHLDKGVINLWQKAHP